MFGKTLLIAVVFLFSGQVHAATVSVFTDRVAWESALTGTPIITETFSNPIAAADIITLDSGIVSTAIPSGLGSVYNSVSVGRYQGYTCLDSSPCPGNPPTEYDWALPFATNAIGGDFFELNSFNGLKIDIDSLGFIGTNIANTIGGKDGFYGLISDTLFDNIAFRCAADGCGDQYSIDDFSVAAVPVPAAVWLFGTALIGFIGFSKRRKAV